MTGTRALQHFPAGDLEPWGIECLGPSAFLRNLYDLDPPVFTGKLIEQSENLDITFANLLTRLRKLVPSFVELFSEEQRIQLSL